MKVQIGMMVDGFDAIITFEVLETAVEVVAEYSRGGAGNARRA